MIILLFLLSGLGCSWFHPFDFAQGARLTGGDPQLGRRALALHSCISCHTIPGVPKGDGNSAPSLAHWSKHHEFIGERANTPENLMQWLHNPAHMKPGTKMPNMNVSEKDSRDMAAYLFSIE
jgi:cytochrome c2